MSYSPRRAAPSSSDKGTKTPERGNRTPNKAMKADVTAAEKKKKKTLTIAIVAVLGIVIVVSLLFIFAPADGSFLGIRGAGVLTGGDNSGGLTDEARSVGGTTNITPYYDNGVLPTASDRHDITLAADGGVNASELYGTWKLDQGTTYVFDGQGKGIMLTGVDNYSFAYSAENGKLGIDMDTVAGNDYEYDYSVSGDTLTMTRDGKTFTLTRTDQ